MNNIGMWRKLIVLAMLWAAATTSSAAQAFKVLFNFDARDNGGDPYYVTLVQGLDGKLYGVTSYPAGTVFKITTEGHLRTTYAFCTQANCPDGAFPYSGLTLAKDGRFYGTTTIGGAYGNSNTSGTIFKISATGAFTPLYSFCSQPNCADGYSPVQTLVQAPDGNFYGTTAYGGAYALTQQDGGTVFRITGDGSFTSLYSFCALPNCSDGAVPWAGPGLYQGTNGNLYGTTQSGGASGNGTAFEITPAGKLKTLYSFCVQPACSDGAAPTAGMVQANDGNFYGTTYLGGANDAGTVFKLTYDGKLSTLYSFCSEQNCGDGAYPFNGGLIQATDGKLYGTTGGGGLHRGGTIFSITLDGAFATLYNFCSLPYCADGHSNAGIMQATDGNFYGTTWGGELGFGTVFSLDTGLGPFVKTLPTYGKVNATIKILGSDLSGTTGVTFGGEVPAAFTIVSKSQIKAVVPAGATTDKVLVATPNGVLSSNTAFRVTPRITRITPGRGPVGTMVTLTGTSLLQTTTVTFGSTAASYTVSSDSQLVTTVPAGAVTGKIVVTTAGGAATSSGTFTVTQ